MIEQKQEGGRNSTSIQIINEGLGYNDVKDICEDVFKENFIRLKNEALEEVNKKIEHFTSQFIVYLQAENISHLCQLKTPDMQYIIFEAQKGFVRNGQSDVDGTLLKLLCERIKLQSIDINMMIYDEAILTSSKLYSKHFDALTIIWIMNNICFSDVHSVEKLSNMYQKLFTPFMAGLTCEIMDLSYLDHHGCGNLEHASLAFRNAKDIFNKCYDKSEIAKEGNLAILLAESSTELKKIFHLWDKRYKQFVLSPIGELIGEIDFNLKIPD